MVLVVALYTCVVLVVALYTCVVLVVALYTCVVLVVAPAARLTSGGQDSRMPSIRRSNLHSHGGGLRQE